MSLWALAQSSYPEQISEWPGSQENQPVLNSALLGLDGFLPHPGKKKKKKVVDFSHKCAYFIKHRSVGSILGVQLWYNGITAPT